MIIKDADHEDALKMYILCDEALYAMTMMVMMMKRNDVRLFMIMVNNINDEYNDVDDDDEKDI